MKILLTSTSFQDTPGIHQEKLKDTGFEVDTLRGPVKEEVLLPVIANYDGIICGDDEITARVISKGKEGNLKVISKYGIGLDKVDLKAAKKNNIPVSNCPGVNHITVSEHVMGLLLTFFKNIHIEYNITQRGEWKRYTGREIYGKKIGIIGLGKIGKEVAIRAKAFGMKVYAYDPYIDHEFINKYEINNSDSLTEMIEFMDIISLNLMLNGSTQKLISMNLIKKALKGIVIINTSRAGVIDQAALIFGLKNKIIGGYLTDVLEEEPMKKNHPLLAFENVIITPHIGSRTYESVQRQGLMAVENLLNGLKQYA